MARKPLMAGNWKMHLNHLEAMHLVQDLAFRLTDADLEAVSAMSCSASSALSRGATIQPTTRRLKMSRIT